MTKYIPRNYSCLKCKKKQYTNKKCYGCGGKIFVILNNDNDLTITLTSEELDIVRNWGLVVSKKRTFNKEEENLYSKFRN